MRRKNRKNQKSSHGISVLCAVIFTLYSFFFLYMLQADVVEALHYSLASDQTTYYPLWGALIITLALMLLRWSINAFIKLNDSWIALSYFPPALLLGVITDVDYSAFHGGGFAPYWAWLLPMLLIIYVIMVFVFKNSFKYSHWNNVLDTYIINLSILTILFLLPACIGNTDTNFHHELTVERCLRRGKYEKALKVGAVSFKSSKTLTILRTAAMAHSNQLGDKLFCYPQLYGSEGLLFSHQTPQTELLRYNADTLYNHFGQKHYVGERNVDYLARISHIDTVPKIAKDYYLSALLLDKNVDRFKEEVNTFYLDEHNLPRYYKEALLWYAQMHPGYQHGITDSILSQKLNQFIKKQQESYASKVIEKNMMRKDYWDTFWWYYCYQ